jgi:hypothetical protein
MCDGRWFGQRPRLGTSASEKRAADEKRPQADKTMLVGHYGTTMKLKKKVK